MFGETVPRFERNAGWSNVRIHPYTAGMLLVFTHIYIYPPCKSNLIETCIYSDLIQSYFLLSTPNLIYYYINKSNLIFNYQLISSVVELYFDLSYTLITISRVFSNLINSNLLNFARGFPCCVNSENFTLRNPEKRKKSKVRRQLKEMVQAISLGGWPRLESRYGCLEFVFPHLQ